jgi:hypothetical protein
MLPSVYGLWLDAQLNVRRYLHQQLCLPVALNYYIAILKDKLLGSLIRELRNAQSPRNVKTE